MGRFSREVDLILKRAKPKQKFRFSPEAIKFDTPVALVIDGIDGIDGVNS